MNKSIIQLHEANKRLAHLDAVALEDFFAYMPMHSYIFAPSRELWPASSINARIPPVVPAGATAKDKPVLASSWVDQNLRVKQMTWAPPDGGWRLDRAAGLPLLQLIPAADNRAWQCRRS
jgi:hypothetical protein